MTSSAHEPGRIAKGRIVGDIMFVDGENMSRKDIACLAFETQDIPKRLIYQSDAAAKKAGYPGFEHVVVPRIGKESVDKNIAMDAVSAWYNGARSIVLVSNDKDYGATALHLKARFPDISITVVYDETRVSARYIDELKRRNVATASLTEDVDLDDFACQVLDVIHELGYKNELNLARLGIELRTKGIEYGRLKNELVKHGLVTKREGEVTLSDLAKKHMPA